MKKAAILLLAFALGFAIGRGTPVGARSPQHRPGDVVLGEASNHQESSAATTRPRAREVPTFERHTSIKPTSDPWLAHVLIDPEHHAPDAQRIKLAILERRETLVAVHACTPLFPSTESKVRLRSHVAISSARIDIDPVESVEVIDGVQLSGEARDCLLKAFGAAVVAVPTHPEAVHPYHGPFDFSISVIGEEPTGTTTHE